MIEKEIISQIMGFYTMTAADQRIGATHISLYMALFRLWMDNNFANPFTINRELAMRWAKINARTTYNKCMKELNDYGYIKYVPSFNFYLGSLVYLNHQGK